MTHPIPQLNKVYQGDCIDVMRSWPADFVHCVVTSPPYWGLRDYGTATWEGGSAECDHGAPIEGGKSGNKGNVQTHAGRFAGDCRRCGAKRIDGQIGLEPAADCLGWATGQRCGRCYVCKMVDVFQEVRRVLRPEGTVWLNLGDSFISAKPGARDGERWPKQERCAHGDRGRDKRGASGPGLKTKDLVGIPWRVALALQMTGWWLRRDQIWVKPNPMRESVKDRPINAHEYVFLLTKRPHYFYDAEAVRVPYSTSYQNDPRHRSGSTPNNAKDGYSRAGAQNPKAVHRMFDKPLEEGALMPSWWKIATQPFNEAHYATFPEKLVTPCVLAGTSAMGACAKCGAPRVRIVKATGGLIGQTMFDHSNEGVTGKKSIGTSRKDKGMDGTYKRETIGWRPSCKCNCKETVPCIVADPFMGSGTTGKVAAGHGRRFIGIDLKPENIPMATRRICPVGTHPSLMLA